MDSIFFRVCPPQRRRHAVRFIFLLTLLGIAWAAGPAAAGWLDTAKEWLDTADTTDSADSDDSGDNGLGNDEIVAGLKDLLRVGSRSVVDQLGKSDGFNLDPEVHIPLPQKLQGVREVLGRIGLDHLTDQLETELNRAAEAATPQAKELFLQAIGDMTVEDAVSIYKGASDAATKYFQEHMTPGLTQAFTPVVAESLSKVGAIASYDRVMGKYRSVPLVPDVKADLTAYVVEKGINGIFHYLAVEEAAIRSDPAKRTTELIQKLFQR